MQRILIAGLSLFSICVVWQSIHRFHSEKLRAVESGGQVIWRGGRLPATEPESVVFTRAFPRSGRQELRLRAWSLTGGTLSLNGEELGDLPENGVRFFRVQGGRLTDPLEFRITAPSKDGWGAVWMAEMSGLGTDGTWSCAAGGAVPAPVRVWGAPPLSSFPALSKRL
jgi:hypothetical protein